MGDLTMDEILFARIIEKMTVEDFALFLIALNRKEQGRDPL